MSIQMYFWVDFSLAATETTNWRAAANDIIRQAYHRVVGENGKEYSDAAFDALNRIVKTFHQFGVPGWKRQQTNNAFSASSEVLISSRNFLCIKPHEAAESNKPITGGEWEVFWVEAGESGGTWIAGTSYTSASRIAVNVGIIDLEMGQAIVRGYKSDLIKKDRIFFEQLDKSSPFGIPKYIWFEKLKDYAYYHVYPFPNNDDVSEAILVTQDIATLADFDTGDTEPDFPVETVDTLVKLLAADISYFEKDIPEKLILHRREAKDALLTTTNYMNKDTDEDPRVFGAYDY